MKRILLCVLAFLALGTSASFAQNSQTDYSVFLAKINSKCPAAAGPGLTFTSVEITDKGVEINIEVNEQTSSVDTLALQKDLLHDVYVSEMITTSDPGMKALRQYSLAFDKPVVIHYTGNITDETFDITILPAELK